MRRSHFHCSKPGYRQNGCRWYFLIFLFSFAFSLLGCSKSSRDTHVTLGDGTRLKFPFADTLRINLSSEPPTLDWNKASDTTSSTVAGNLMEGLVQYNLSDPELGLLPALATRFVPSEDAKKWTFTLRQDVKWSDGVPFTAQHVIDGWRRVLSRETASEYSYFLFPIKNAQAFSQGKLPWGSVGVHQTGPYEIVVELEKPMGYFPELLTHASTFPIRLDVVQKYGEAWTEPSHIVTLGPYRLKAWVHDKLIVFERNDSYYGGRPAIKTIVAYMIQEQTTALNLFDSGRLDAVHSLPSIELRFLRKRPEYRQFGVLSLYYYGTNTEKPPMNNVKVRKAVSQAIDRKELVQMLDGGEIPTSSWVPSGMFGFEPDRGLKFDPEKARELLKQAMNEMGIAKVADFPRIEIKFNTSEDHERIAQNIQAQLKRNLGINVELKNEEWKVFLKTLKTDPPHLYRFGWVADYPDPDNFLSVLTSFSENNRTRWKSKKYDDLVLRAAGLTDKEKRRELYSEAQKIITEEDVPVVPLYVAVSHSLISSRVVNYPKSSMNLLIYKDVSLKGDDPK